MSEGWLIDKSAIVRMPTHVDESIWSQRVDQGLVHICAITLLELGYSTRNGTDHARLLGTTALSRMIIEWDLPPRVTRRAYEVQGMLAAVGQHRAPSVADLLIAASAEMAGLTVLHDDKDFDVIGAITGQSLHRL